MRVEERRGCAPRMADYTRTGWWSKAGGPLSSWYVSMTLTQLPIGVMAIVEGNVVQFGDKETAVKLHPQPLDFQVEA